MKKYTVRIDLTSYQYCYVNVIASDEDDATNLANKEFSCGNLDDKMRIINEDYEFSIISSEDYNGLQTNL